MSLIKNIKKHFWHWVDTREIHRLSMNPNRFTQRERVVYRFLETIQGSLTWITLVGSVLISLFSPVTAVLIIFVFDLYWLFKLVIFLLFMIIAWSRYRRDRNRDWSADLVQKFPETHANIVHVILLPFWKEPYEVLRHTVKALASSHYDVKRMIVVLPGEERNADHCRSVQQRLEEEFHDVFFGLISTLHPLAPGELAGKAANQTYACKIVKKYLDERGIEYRNVILSAFDSDTVAHPKYFACLTYHYLSNPKPVQASYQPITVYSNNMWESSWMTRVVSNSTTFWLLGEFGRNADRLISYASHSIPFQTLVDVGFWQVDMVNDDARIFLQAYLHYHGDYRLVPLNVPVYMDTVDAGSFWKTLKNQYLQVRRWGYGAEHVPYLLFHLWKDTSMSFSKKFKPLFLQIEGYFFWATAPIMMLVMGRLPLLVMDMRNDPSIVLQRMPNLLEMIMQVGMIGIIVSAIMNISFIPVRPVNSSRFKYIAMFLQWLFLPVSMIVFGSIPVTDAQTRLMLGKYLGFWNTEKIRKA